MFSANPNDQFVRAGWTPGGSLPGDTVNKTLDQLLTTACTDEKGFQRRDTVRNRLAQLRQRYNDPAWHRHYTVTQFERKEREGI
jgi:hypothetical protein